MILKKGEFSVAQPVKTDQRISDVVRSTEMIRQSSSRIQHRLESASQVDQKTGQHTVAEIHSNGHDYIRPHDAASFEHSRCSVDSFSCPKLTALSPSDNSWCRLQKLMWLWGRPRLFHWGLTEARTRHMIRCDTECLTCTLLECDLPSVSA